MQPPTASLISIIKSLQRTKDDQMNEKDEEIRRLNEQLKRAKALANIQAIRRIRIISDESEDDANSGKPRTPGRGIPELKERFRKHKQD